MCSWARRDQTSEQRVASERAGELERLVRFLDVRFDPDGVPSHAPFAPVDEALGRPPRGAARGVTDLLRRSAAHLTHPRRRTARRAALDDRLLKSMAKRDRDGVRERGAVRLVPGRTTRPAAATTRVAPRREANPQRRTALERSLGREAFE